MRAALALSALLLASPASAGLLATVEVEAAGISQRFTGEIKGDPKDYTRDVLAIVRQYAAAKRTVQFELRLRPDERGGDRLVYALIMNIQDPKPTKIEVLVLEGRAVFPLGRQVTVFADPGRIVKVRLDAIAQ